MRSHTQVPGNELADWLAERGAAGARTSRATAHRWLSAWVQKAAKQAEAEVTDTGTHRDPTGVG